MEQWETNFFAQVLRGDLKMASEVVRSNKTLSATPPVQILDNAFKMALSCRDQKMLEFLNQTGSPSVSALPVCINHVIDWGKPSVWKWVEQQIAWHMESINELQWFKPMRITERGLGLSVKKQNAYHCVRAMLPHLSEKNCAILALFAVESNHVRAAQELLKKASMQHVQEHCERFSSPRHPKFELMQQLIAETQNTRLKQVLKKETASPVSTKRKM